MEGHHSIKQQSTEQATVLQNARLCLALTPSQASRPLFKLHSLSLLPSNLSAGGQKITQPSVALAPSQYHGHPEILGRKAELHVL